MLNNFYLIHLVVDHGPEEKSLFRVVSLGCCSCFVVAHFFLDFLMPLSKRFLIR